MKNIKSFFILHASFFMSLALFGAANNTVITYEVPTTSVYADGSPVQSGERYALVFLPDDAGGEFAIAADGTEVDTANGRILKIKVANYYRGRCLFEFQLTPDEAKACADGELAIYLLDTRVFAQSGAVSYSELDAATGRPTVVNAAIEIEEAKIVNVAASRTQAANAASAAAVSSKPPYQVATATAIPADAAIENPVIKAMRIENGKIILTVEKTSPLISYDVTKSGACGGFIETALPGSSEFDSSDGGRARSTIAPDSSASSVRTHAAVAPKNGVAGETIELTVPIETNEGAAFFKVERH